MSVEKYICVILLALNACYALRFGQSISYVTPIIRQIGVDTFDPFNASLLIVETTGCSDSDIPRKSSGNVSIVFFTALGGCYPDKKIINAEKAGYDACLIVNDRGNLGVLSFYWHFGLVRSNIPALEIVEWDANSLLENEDLQEVLISDNEQNPWDSFNLLLFYPFSLIIGGYSALIFFVALYKFYAFYKAGNLKFNLAVKILCIEMLSCLIRFAYVIDPQSIHHIIPWGWHEVFLTNTFTLSLDTNVMVWFYWLALLKQKDAGPPALHWLKWPCYIFISVFTIFDAISSAGLGLMIFSSKIILIKGLIFIATGFLSASAFIFTGVKVYTKIRKVIDAKKSIWRLLFYIVGTGICLFWFTGVSISVPFSFRSPLSWYLINLLAFLATESVSILTILSFRTHGSNSSSKTSVPSEMKPTSQSLESGYSSGNDLSSPGSE